MWKCAVALAVAVVLAVVQLASSENVRRTDFHAIKKEAGETHRKIVDIPAEESVQLPPYKQDKTEEAPLDLEEFADEMVDLKVERMEDKKMALEFKSHGRLHKFELKESRQRVEDINVMLMGSSEEEQGKANNALKGVKLMQDTKFGAVVAVKDEADGITETIIKSGVFSLGKHEFHILPETGSKAKIRKRSIDEVKHQSDGLKAPIELNRYKRSDPANVTKVDAVVELLLIVDLTLWQRFSDLVAVNTYFELVLYFSQMVGIMDSHYGNMVNDDLCIEVRLVTILVLTQPTALPFLIEDHTLTVNEYDYIHYSALNRLFHWLASNDSNFLGPYDHAMLLTGKDLYYYGGSGLLGVAWLSTICDPAGSSSLVEIRATLTANAFVATHELGHSLGSDHDTESYSVNCPNDNYIMSASAGQTHMLQNKYQFSCCSQRSFYTTIHNRECLYQNTAISGISPLIDYYQHTYSPGQIYDADTQCYIAYGTGACNVTNPGICLALFCVRPLAPWDCITDWVGAADGTPCGVDKSCYQGQCQLNFNLIDHDNECDVRRCFGNEGRCRNGYNVYDSNWFVCYPQSWRCDGWKDCSCGSDEVDCPRLCPEGWTECTTGESIFPDPLVAPQCFPSAWICDNITDCADGSDEVDCPRDITTTTTTTTESPPVGCGSYRSEESGSIEAPAGVGDKYANLANCFWTIQAPPGMVVEVTFARSDTIEDDMISCSYDFMLLESGYGAGKIAKLCGDVTNLDAYVSVNDVMYITFVSDGEVAYRKWILNWQVHCPGLDPMYTENCGLQPLQCSMVTISDCDNCYQVRDTCCNACAPTPVCEDENGLKKCKRIKGRCVNDIVKCESDCEAFSERCCDTCCELFERFCP